MKIILHIQVAGHLLGGVTPTLIPINVETIKSCNPHEVEL